MNRLTIVEKECQEVLLAIGKFWTMSPTKVTVGTYQDLMGRIRTVTKHLENKEFGCASGRHAGQCTCKENGDVGHSIQAR